MEYKTIRIPATRNNHLVDKKYIVNPEWINRLKNVVDLCRDKGLYIIINIHYDNANFKKYLLNMMKDIIH
jgi:endoglucanase